MIWYDTEWEVVGAWTGRTETEGLKWGWQRELGSWFQRHGGIMIHPATVCCRRIVLSLCLDKDEKSTRLEREFQTFTITLSTVKFIFPLESAVMDEGRMRSIMVVIPFSVLTLLVGWQKVHTACTRKPVPLMPKVPCRNCPEHCTTTHALMFYKC